MEAWFDYDLPSELDGSGRRGVSTGAAAELEHVDGTGDLTGDH